MNPIDEALGWVAAVLLAAVVVLGLWVDHDERALGAATAACNNLRTQDAKDANDAVASLLKAQVDKDALAADEIRQSQAKADAAHEKTMLDIQHRKDTAAQHYEDASHDKAAIAWADLPVPPDYALGMCASLGNCPGPGGSTPAGTDTQSRPQGPGADSGHAAASHHHRQPAADRDEALDRPGGL